MAKKLKTYQTSLGFFDLAIAAPSMKAALEAWGADSNLFHQGAAKESDDPDVIAATTKKPGVVLRRPVGSDGSFTEHAELPTDLGGGGRPTKAARGSGGRKGKKPPSRPVDKAAERGAALAYEREQTRREGERAREEAARQRSANAGSRPSTRRKRRWTWPSGIMRREPGPSRPRWRRSRTNRKPKMLAGTRRRSAWKPHCGARGARLQVGR
jgi:hypothetical protein